MTFHSFALWCLCLSVMLCCSGCGPTQVTNSWEGFGKTMMDAGRRHDVNYLVNSLSFSDDIIIGEWFLKTYLQNRPSAKYIPPEKKPQLSRIVQIYNKHILLFLRSYEHILDGELACVATSPQREYKGIDSRSVVIWIRKDEKYHGMFISQAVQTPWGIKVNDWNNQEGMLPWKKTANLVRSDIGSCPFPKSIGFTYA